MNKKFVWIATILTALSFAALLLIQMRYMMHMVRMNRERFAQSVMRSLDQASHAMERRETFEYLKKVASDDGYQLENMPIIDTVALGRMLSTKPAAIDTTFRLRLPRTIRKILKSDLMDDGKIGSPTTLEASAQKFQNYVRDAFLYQKDVLDEVVFKVLYNASESRFEDRVDFDVLTMEITRALRSNGIDRHYHLIVNTADGREIYRCSEYETRDGEATFQMVLFRNDPVDKMGTMVVNFPDYSRFSIGAAGLMLPAIIFTLLLLFSFMFAIWFSFRQKQVSQMRNDFVHNMTHEFKTPLSSISLAAEMLADTSVPKSESLLARLSNTIVSESKRLRLQVDKVLHVSLFDSGSLKMKFIVLDVHRIVEEVADIFSLRVQQAGGNLSVHMDAQKHYVYADEMHFTNVIYNLLDNAFKYRREEVPLQIEITVTNPTPTKVNISIADNGMGIRRDSVKHIFDRFYRVPTGDTHNVKGFGLGLSYVKAIIGQHQGTITCESAPGQGTTFIISLPTSVAE
ncbi:MAG: HAMP domain-containing histidine kinase [Bacteroidaceae bacterium]|nr:HAMP domain-containing histidine kinase [Bacteroidaceae bacterium]